MNGGDREGVRILLFSEITLFKNSVSTILSPIVGKHDLSTVYLGELDFLSVTDFSPGNLPRENFYRLGLGYVSRTIEFPLTATPKQ